MKTIVFLGPSLPVSEARRILDADFRPPAAQGDVFRAVEAGPKNIVLIDGVFETAPSVWHHELRAAHAAGIQLYGASSMGALRAAELPHLIAPVGEIARRFVSGEWNDDAAVALLHADREHDYRGLTVPWVNVWATAQAARRAGILSLRQAQALCHEAEGQFYQTRTWQTVFDGLGWNDGLRKRVLVRAVNLKAVDAAVCLQTVAKKRSRAALRLPQASRFSSFVRRTRLKAHSEDFRGWEQGVKTLLLADFARQAQVEPDEQLVAAWRARLAGPFGADQLEEWAQALALEEMVLMEPTGFISDGPSRLEGAALAKALALGKK